jgi:hypothetical protein
MSSNICSVENCESRIKCRKLCAGHYSSHRAKGLIEDRKNRLCMVAGCGRPFYSRNFCAVDYQRYYIGLQTPNQTVCMVANCPGAIHREGHCYRHYMEIFPKEVTSKLDCRIGDCTEPRQPHATLCKRHHRLEQLKAARAKADREKLREAKRLERQLAAQKPACIETDCDRPARSMDRCQLHYHAWKHETTQGKDFWEFVKAELQLEGAK